MTEYSNRLVHLWLGLDQGLGLGCFGAKFGGLGAVSVALRHGEVSRPEKMMVC